MRKILRRKQALIPRAKLTSECFSGQETVQRVIHVNDPNIKRNEPFIVKILLQKSKYFYANVSDHNNQHELILKVFARNDSILFFHSYSLPSHNCIGNFILCCLRSVEELCLF